MRRLWVSSARGWLACDFLLVSSRSDERFCCVIVSLLLLVCQAAGRQQAKGARTMPRQAWQQGPLHISRSAAEHRLKRWSIMRSFFGSA
jgi:hypothetical protein